jgi:hypothetical protein
MTRPLVLVALALSLVAACSSGPVAPSATTSPAQPTGDIQPSPTGGSLVPIPGGFDIDRVRLMEPADLPEGVPVPVPFGGEIDESIGAFEGELLAVDYDARFFATAAAFYAAWIEQEGLSASPLVAFSPNAAGWEVIVDGEPVRIELTIAPDGSATQLRISWD